MTGLLNFEQILPQLQHAYLTVLQMADEQEIRRLKSYFQEDGTPYMQTICVPDRRNTGMWRKIDIPLYALIPTSSLRVKELTVEFEGTLTGLDGFEIIRSEPSKTQEKKPRSRRQKTRGGTAQVRITLKNLPSVSEDGTLAYNSKVGVDITIVYPGETLHSYRILD